MSSVFAHLSALPQEQAFDAMGKMQEEELPLLSASLMVARDDRQICAADAQLTRIARSSGCGRDVGEQCHQQRMRHG